LCEKLDHFTKKNQTHLNHGTKEYENDHVLESNPEIILAQEQSVLAKLGFEKDLEGTLVLTNQRLLFVIATEQEDVRTGGGYDILRFANVDDLNSIPMNPQNLSIPIGKIDFDKGRSFLHPTLRIKWVSDSGEKQAEFVEKITGGKKKNLNDWANVISKIKSGAISLEIPKSSPPSIDTLEGKILFILGDMQDKGTFEIEEDVEGKFKVDLDPDEVEASCKKLAQMRFVDEIADSSGDNFYRKHSPLGEDDLSS
jgi:hypothetical protein